MENTLICTLGGSTPVVTETIDALLSKNIKIGKVIVVHTSTPVLKEKKEGKYDLSLDGLKKDIAGYYGKLICAEFIELPFDDILSEDHNDKLLRTLMETMEREKKQKNKVYLSIAGGRKTMSAMALFAAYFIGCDGIYHIITKGNEFQLSRDYGLHPPVEQLILIEVPLIDLSSFWKSAIMNVDNPNSQDDSILSLIKSGDSVSKGVERLSNRLIATMSNMKLAEEYQRLFPVFNNLCLAASGVFEHRLKDLKIRMPDIQQRVKTLVNIRRNIIRYGENNKKIYTDPLHELKDISACRIICYTANDVKKLCDHIDSGKIPEFTFLGREEHKKRLFGYRAVHYQLKVNKEYFSKADYAAFRDFECELQVKTIFAHSWASIEHSTVYKSEMFGKLSKEKKAEFEEKFIQIGAQLKTTEDEFDHLLEEVAKEIRKASRSEHQS